MHIKKNKKIDLTIFIYYYFFFVLFINIYIKVIIIKIISNHACFYSIYIYINFCVRIRKQKNI